MKQEKRLKFQIKRMKANGYSKKDIKNYILDNYSLYKEDYIDLLIK